MSVLGSNKNGEKTLYIKGAPEMILNNA